MRALATFIMQGQSRAVMVVAVMAVLSFLLPPLALLSGGGVALVVLHRGGHDGLRVIAWSSVALAALIYALQQDLSPVVGFALVMWLPVWLVAVVLQATGQPAWALSGAAGLAVLLVLAVYLVLGDPAQMWRDMLHGLFEKMQDAAVLEPGEVDMQALLEQLAAQMTGAMGAALMLGVALSLLLGRWWQSQLYNSGGFGSEFRGLRFHRLLAFLTIGLMLLGPMLGGSAGQVAMDAVLPVFLLFVLQGFALAHAVVQGRGMSKGWLVGLYVALAIMPGQVTLIVGVLGLLDSLADFRTRFGIGAAGSE